MNAILDSMSAHRSVRAYRPTPLSDKSIRRAVAAAQGAATSGWIQAYALLQVTHEDERARLVELTGSQPQVAQAGAFFVVCADVRRHQLVARSLDKPYASNLETFLLAVIDASLFAQNLNLAFESMGYGTCFIGGLRNRLPEVDRLLHIPQGVWPLFGLCVGEPDPDVPTRPRPRLPVEAVWMKDRYLDDAVILAHIETHDAAAAADYAERGYPGRSWTGGLWRKFAQPLRDDLADYYRSKGAALQRAQGSDKCPSGDRDRRDPGYHR